MERLSQSRIVFARKVDDRVAQILDGTEVELLLAAASAGRGFLVLRMMAIFSTKELIRLPASLRLVPPNSEGPLPPKDGDLLSRI